MSTLRFLLPVITALGLALAGVGSAAPAPSEPRQLWQLLDYVGVDYREAVADGKVIDEGEYAEMRDFTANALRLAQALPSHSQNGALLTTIRQLQYAVDQKAKPSEVAMLARQANTALTTAHPIDRAPKKAIDLKQGAALYQQHCAACHGAWGAGDGSAGKALDPPPIAFTDAERAKSRSLLALYQAITQGVAGTGMPSFAALSDMQRWDLAFYVGTLAYASSAASAGRELWQRDATLQQQLPDLAAVTTVTEEDLAAARPPAQARSVVGFLRHHPQEHSQSQQQRGLALTKERLQASRRAMHAGQSAEATRLALSAYLDGFEPLEAALSSAAPALVVRIEDSMLAYRHAVSTGRAARADETADDILALLDDAESALERTQGDFTTAFLGALTILLREGLEALLIVIGMTAFLRKANQPQAVRAVHAGWISALIAGGATWLVATYAVAISGFSREVTEGLSSLLAALVLLGVGLWMHHKSAAGRWQVYLQAHLSSALSQRSYWALFGLAFIAVYREVFETVLFISALGAQGNGSGLAAGLTSAALLLTTLAWVLLKTSARMPIGPFFSTSAAVVAILAVVLAGKGVAGLQEAGWVGVTPTALPRIELLGLYPTWQSLTGQILVASVALAGFARNRRQARLTVAA